MVKCRDYVRMLIGCCGQAARKQVTARRDGLRMLKRRAIGPRQCRCGGKWAGGIGGAKYVQRKSRFWSRPRPSVLDEVLQLLDLLCKTRSNWVAHRNHLLVLSFVFRMAGDQPGTACKRASSSAINSE